MNSKIFLPDSGVCQDGEQIKMEQISNVGHNFMLERQRCATFWQFWWLSEKPSYFKGSIRIKSQ